MQESHPIFIGGDGRSGTTLLSVILDSHPVLRVGPELHFRGPPNLGPYILRCLGIREGCSSTEEWVAHKKDKELYTGVHFVNRCHRFGIEPRELRGFVEQAMHACSSDLESFEDRCALIEILGECTRRRSDASRWGIKIMREIRVLDWYAKVWPKAQFVHIIRDGRDVASSQMTEHASWGYEDIEQAAVKWVELIRRVRRSTNAERIYELRYEDLVCEPLPTLRQLVDFLKVSWNEEMLRHQSQELPLFRNPYDHPSIDTVVRPINSSAVGRYRRDLSSKQIEAFEEIAGDSLRELGYKSPS